MKKRQQSDLLRLLREIRRVNPTGRNLSKAETAARYAEKARLQSILIETFPTEVRVQLHDDMPGVVSLSAPRLTESAGHAVVEALSARARAWVEAACVADADTFSPSSPTKAVSESAALEATPLQRARRFLRDYDYDCAETALREALDAAHPANVRTAAYELLLELLVSILGRDEDALALGLGTATPQGTPKADALLSLAAARAGHVDEALRRVHGELSEELLRHFHELAKRAAERGAWQDVRRVLERIPRMALVKSDAPRAPPSAPVSPLDVIRVMLADVSAARLHDDSDLLFVVELLAPRHPGLARYVEGVERDRRLQTAELRLQRVAKAVESGDVVGADEALRAARRMTDMMSEEQRRLFESLESRAQEQRVQKIASRFCVDEIDHDLVVEYLSLPASLRGAVLNANDDRGTQERLRLAERLAALGGSHHAAARAAGAWAGYAGRPTEDGSELAPHAALLRTDAAIAVELDRILEAHGDGARTRRAVPALHIDDQSVTAEVTCLSLAPPNARLLCASRTLVIHDRECVVAAFCWANCCEVWVRPISPAFDAIGIQLVLPEGVVLSHVLVEGHAVHLVDSARANRRVELLDESQSWSARITRLDDLCPLPQDSTLAVCADQVVMLLGAAVAARCEAVIAGTRRPWTTRLEGTTLLRTGIRCGSSERIDLPGGVRPHLVVESPLGEKAPPVIVETLPNQEPAFVWWRASIDLWRGFGLGPASGSQSLLEAHSLNSGILVVAPSDKVLVLHHVAFLDGALVYGGSTRHEHATGVATDATRRRAWIVRRTQVEACGFATTRVQLRAKRRIKPRNGVTAAAEL